MSQEEEVAEVVSRAREIVNRKKHQVIFKFPDLFCEYLGNHPIKGPHKIFGAISIDEFQKFLHDNKPRCIGLELLSIENDEMDGFKAIFIDEPENNLNEQDDSSSILVRSYRKTEIDTNEPKKYQREYYRKYRSGELGHKRNVIRERPIEYPESKKHEQGRDSSSSYCDANKDKILEKAKRKTTKTRKSPILTYVKGHRKKDGRWIEGHWRGGEPGEKEAQNLEVIEELTTKSYSDDPSVGLDSLFKENLEE